MNGLVKETPFSSCSYTASSKATAEYQKLSGCDKPVPLEGCSFTDKTCFKTELMTGYDGGKVVLSRMTVASLEDMGYTVNYDAADDYGVEDMDPSCVCATTSTIKIGDVSTTKVARSKPTVRKLGTGKFESNHAHLSLSGRLEAEAFGLELLKAAQRRKKYVIEREGYAFLADQVVSVLYMEKGQIYGIEVRSE